MQEEIESQDSQAEIRINAGGILVGFILFASLVWSIYYTEMEFAYLNSILLFALAIGNHAINTIYS